MNEKEVIKSKRLTESLTNNSCNIGMKDILMNQSKNQDVSSSFSLIIESDKISNPHTESSEVSLP